MRRKAYEDEKSYKSNVFMDYFIIDYFNLVVSFPVSW